MRRPILIFDGDCGFCTRSVTWLYAVAGPAAPAHAYQRVDLPRYGLTEARAAREMLWVGPGGEVRGGVRAFAALLRTARAPGWRWAGRALDAPPLRWLAHPVYRLIARHRHRMPGGTAACAVRPDNPHP